MTGGIQRLMGELVDRVGWQTLVITLAHPQAADTGPTHRVEVVPAARKGSLLLLNAATVKHGRRWRPDAVLCGHIVTSPGAAALGRLLGVPVVQYVYSKEITGRPKLTTFAVTRAAATIAISQHTTRLAISAGASAENVTTIEPGVDPVEAEPPLQRAQPPTILTVARLRDRYKGFDVMLRALPLVRSQIPAVRWVVVGDGELRPELEATAATSGLSDAVLFTGRVSDAERDAWYARAHVFAMPSRVPPDGGGEGYGIVYMEAGMRGLSCIAGNAGAVAETVLHDETGLLVDAHDPAEVADALIALLRDPERARRLGQAGRQRALERSWDRMVREVETLVEQTVEAWPARRRNRLRRP